MERWEEIEQELLDGGILKLRSNPATERAAKRIAELEEALREPWSEFELDDGHIIEYIAQRSRRAALEAGVCPWSDAAARLLNLNVEISERLHEMEERCDT